MMKKFKESLENKKKKRLIVFDFITNELPDIYALADLAIARSGAGTVNELMALNIPAIFIPLAIATKNEQLRNARYVEKIGGSVIIEERDLNAKLLCKNIEDILFSNKLSKMKENLKNHSITNGTKKMIDLILKIIGK
jgi:UDP-N-acetylglucosamine--N-acetylmuramyl-(pentapeptide) pyrophosphoryl-undecaprenol N-acetylglucosamine transferase